LFLRKERGSLKLAKFKIQETEFILNLEKFNSNKISAQKIEIQSLEKQNTIIKKLAQDYTLMLKSEERLFSFWKALCFNKQQENNLISSQLASIVLENRYFVSNSELF
jgi:hypothetical protein